MSGRSSSRFSSSAYAQHDMTLLQATFQPAFDWLEEDARFRALLERCRIKVRRAAS